jgi:pantoate--beta-alanine ligase
MQVVKTVDALRVASKSLEGVIGLVPTMGALHDGHMALVYEAISACDTVIATIFVNPTQFGPNEDLSSYPRTLERDLGLLGDAGVDVVFVPDDGEMYPNGHQTSVTVKQVSQSLEGEHRPGHFEGVATVVAKLFNLTQPDRAYFGQKDAQQVVVIRQMVRDLNFPVLVIPVPTVRELDGLALSSRNAYLNDDERNAATVLSLALDAATSAYEGGERDVATLRAKMWDALNAEPLAKVDYVSLADARTLIELEGNVSDDLVILASLTVQIGKPRLLDNRLLPRELNTVAGLTSNLGPS